MIRVSVKHTSVGHFGIVILNLRIRRGISKRKGFDLHPSVVREHARSGTRYLLLSMASVGQKQCIGNTSNNQYSVRHVILASSPYLQTLLVLGLLLVDYPEAEVDLICLFEIWLHAHDL